MIKRILIGLFIVILAALAIAYVWMSRKSPKYSGELDKLSLSTQADVYFDEYGIPHIYAGSMLDAQKVLGYLHAQERLWQMELVRRVMPGRLSEILGSATLETDRLFRSLHVEDYIDESVKRFHNEIDPSVKELALAYLDGVNAFVEHGFTPIEYNLLGIGKEKFTVRDVYSIISYTAFSFAMGHKTDPIVSMINERYGPAYVNDLAIEPDSTTAWIPSNNSATALSDLSLGVHRAMDQMPVGQWIGSNSWVISGSKTKSGKPIFANDPHMVFAQPGVWYEAHIQTPEMESYGYYMACFPFPHLVHNSQKAVGLTMLMNDDLDFIEFIINPDDSTQYLYDGAWREFETVQKTVKVKDSIDFVFDQLVTPYGPVVNDGIEEINHTNPIGMWWSFVRSPNALLEASHGLQMAQNMDDARSSAKQIHAPGLNVMYADSENVAWWPSAKLVKRPDSIDSRKIELRDAAIHQKYDFYPHSDNPGSENPQNGYVYSANNQPISATGQLFDGYYLPEDRARRITSLLDEKDDWSVHDVKSMLLDDTSENATEIVNAILSYIDQSKLSEDDNNILTGLSKWDGHHSAESWEAVLYNKLIAQFYALTMGDELGEEVSELFNGTHLMLRSIQKVIENPNSVWWDNIATAPKESNADIAYQIWMSSITELSAQLGDDHLSWRWDSVHKLTHEHALGVVDWLASYLNVGQYNVAGGKELINNLMYTWDSDGIYQVYAGPSTRRIVDFSDVRNNSWSILPTGQSGVPASQHYGDQAEAYANGQYRRQLMDRKLIESSGYRKLTFK